KLRRYTVIEVKNIAITIIKFMGLNIKSKIFVKTGTFSIKSLLLYHTNRSTLFNLHHVIIFIHTIHMLKQHSNHTPLFNRSNSLAPIIYMLYSTFHLKLVRVAPVP